MCKNACGIIFVVNCSHFLGYFQMSFLQTAPGTLTPVEEQALDSVRQLRCFKAELLGGAGALWSS